MGSLHKNKPPNQKPTQMITPLQLLQLREWNLHKDGEFCDTFKVSTPNPEGKHYMCDMRTDRCWDRCVTVAIYNETEKASFQTKKTKWKTNPDNKHSAQMSEKLHFKIMTPVLGSF